MKFEIGKLYKNLEDIRFWCLLNQEMVLIPAGTIMLYVSDQDFYKDTPRKFLIDNHFFIDSRNYSYKDTLSFEEIITE